MKRVTIMRLSLNGRIPCVEVTRVKNITGDRFGRLVAKRFYKRGADGGYYWECACDCGNTRIVRECNLTAGTTKSCGCFNRESSSARMAAQKTTHNMSRTKIYWAWCSMLKRCHNRNHIAYKNYGGRGIRVCKRWHKFENFYADMGDRPTPKHTLDRIDNNGNYCKENCRWASVKTQHRNTRVNRTITFRGKTKCVSAWAACIGLSNSTLLSRLSSGWSIERALTTPVCAR